MSDNIWLQNAKDNLLPLSLNKFDFFEAKKEWMYAGLFDNDNANFHCQLCGHPEIRYEYTIRNRFNNNEMIVGSSCIIKFIDHLSLTQEFLSDADGYQVTYDRLKEDKHTYWKKILFNALDDRFNNGDFQKSITFQIKNDGRLTVNQARCLRQFYNSLSQNEQTAFRNIVSIKLRGDIHKEQYKTLYGLDKEFIIMLMNSEQRSRMDEF